MTHLRPEDHAALVGGRLPCVAIESRFAGDVARNEAFARHVVRDALHRGFAGWAMHLLYPQVLDDMVPAERTLGIQAGLSWTDHADEVWFAVRPGETLSSGMLAALVRHQPRLADGARIGRLMVYTQEGVLLQPEALTTPLGVIPGCWMPDGLPYDVQAPRPLLLQQPRSKIDTPTDAPVTRPVTRRA